MDKNNRGSPKLTVKQEKFVQGIIEGKSQRRGYIEAGYSTGNMSPEFIDKKACELFNTSKVQGRYRELMEEHKKKAIITREDLVRGLAEVFFKATGKIYDEQSVITYNQNEEGIEEVVEVRKDIKKSDLKNISSIAAEIAKLEGFYPEKEKQNINVAPVINISGVKDD